MKKVFKMKINGNFTQYLKLSESKLLSQIFSKGDTITLECVEITTEKYNIVFGIEVNN